MTRGRSITFAGIVLVALALIGLGACSKKTVPVQPGVGPGTGSGGMTEQGISPEDAKWKELGLYTEPERQEFQQKAQVFENQDIFFGFDSYVLSDEAKRILNDKAAFLKRYPKVKVTVEGHCDERGTAEYNLALGERRAHSAYQYLVNLGVSAQQMTTISYGEERPLVTGQSEDAWAKNRRDHFAVNY